MIVIYFVSGLGEIFLFVGIICILCSLFEDGGVQTMTIVMIAIETILLAIYSYKRAKSPLKCTSYIKKLYFLQIINSVLVIISSILLFSPYARKIDNAKDFLYEFDVVCRMIFLLLGYGAFYLVSLINRATTIISLKNIEKINSTEKCNKELCEIWHWQKLSLVCSIAGILVGWFGGYCLV